MVRGGQALVRALEAHGVETVFGIPGVHSLEAYDALYDSDRLTTILPRHEQGAGFMADGYSRATGKPGVALIVTGPGVTNIATATGEAFADSSRVLVIATNQERKHLDKLVGNLHEMTDQMSVLSSVTKWSTRVNDSGEIAPAIDRAFDELLSGRPRPVYVEIPLDVLTDETELEPASFQLPAPVAPNPEQIAQAAKLIASARRVFILAGGGTNDEAAASLLRDLAHELGAPVCTSLMGKGSIPEDDAFATGAFGYRWSAESPVVPLMTGSDLTIAIGTGLGIRTTGNQTMPLSDTLIHIDIDSNEIGQRYPTTLGIVADAAATLRALLDVVRAGNRPSERWSEDEVEEVQKANAKPEDARVAGYLPYLKALRAAIPRDGILVNDMTMMSYEGVRHYPVYVPRTYTFPRGFGTLGSSLPTALGAKLGRPDRAVVSVNGDGGFQFTMEEIGAAVHHKIALPIVIFNDSTHTAVKAAMRREHPGRYLDVDLINPDYVKLADAYGILGVRAGSADELQERLQDALAKPGPTIIDVPIALERY